MRKLSLLLLALFVVSGTAFAQMSIEPTIEVEASATFGVQLDEMTTGISNAAEATLGFVFTEEQTEEFGEGDVYGWIELEDFKVEFDSSGDDATDEGALDVSVGSVTGKLMLGPAYISLDEATTEVNEAGAFALIDESILGYGLPAIADWTGDGVDDAVGYGVAFDYKGATGPEFPGVALGFEVPDVATIEFGVASAFDWAQSPSAAAVPTLAQYDAARATLNSSTASQAAKDAAQDVVNAYEGNNKLDPSGNTNDNNEYVMSIDAEITAVENVTIALVSAMSFGKGYTDPDDATEQKNGTPGTPGNPVAVGLSVEYDYFLNEDLELSPKVGFDLYSEQDAQEDPENRMEIGFGVALDWSGLGLDEDEDDHIDFIGDATDDDEEEVTSGVYLGAVYGIHSSDLVGTTADEDETINTMKVLFGLYEDSGDEGLLPVVGGALMADYVTIFENEDANVPNAFSQFGLGAEVNADLGVVSPYAGLKIVMSDLEEETLTNPTTGDKEMRGITTINLGTDINVIANTTFTIDYASGNLQYNDEYYSENDATYGPTYGNITSSTAKMGVVTVKTAIEF